MPRVDNHDEQVSPFLDPVKLTRALQALDFPLDDADESLALEDWPVEHHRMLVIMLAMTADAAVRDMTLAGDCRSDTALTAEELGRCYAEATDEEMLLAGLQARLRMASASLHAWSQAPMVDLARGLVDVAESLINAQRASADGIDIGAEVVLAEKQLLGLTVQCTDLAAGTAELRRAVGDD